MAGDGSYKRYNTVTIQMGRMFFACTHFINVYIFTLGQAVSSPGLLVRCEGSLYNKSENLWYRLLSSKKIKERKVFSFPNLFVVINIFLLIHRYHFDHNGQTAFLTVNSQLMASGGVFTPPCCKIFNEEYLQILCIWYLGHVTKNLLANFQNNFKSSCPWDLSRDLF